jgi:hypothetical protein
MDRYIKGKTLDILLVKKVSYCMSEKQSKAMFPSTTLVQVRKAKPVKVNLGDLKK